MKIIAVLPLHTGHAHTHLAAIAAGTLATAFALFALERPAPAPES